MLEQEKELTNLKEQLEKMKNLKYRSEAKIEQLQKRKQEILEEIRELGVNPEKLDWEIGNLEAEIALLLKQVKQALPLEILQKAQI